MSIFILFFCYSLSSAVGSNHEGGPFSDRTLQTQGHGRRRDTRLEVRCHGHRPLRHGLPNHLHGRRQRRHPLRPPLVGRCRGKVGKTGYTMLTKRFMMKGRTVSCRAFWSLLAIVEDYTDAVGCIILSFGTLSCSPHPSPLGNRLEYLSSQLSETFNSYELDNHYNSFKKDVCTLSLGSKSLDIIVSSHADMVLCEISSMSFLLELELIHVFVKEYLCVSNKVSSRQLWSTNWSLFKERLWLDWFLMIWKAKIFQILRKPFLNDTNVRLRGIFEGNNDTFQKTWNVIWNTFYLQANVIKRCLVLFSG